MVEEGDGAAGGHTMGSISCDRLHYFILIHVLFHKAYSLPSVDGSVWHIHSLSWLISKYMSLLTSLSHPQDVWCIDMLHISLHGLFFSF